MVAASLSFSGYLVVARRNFVGAKSWAEMFCVKILAEEKLSRVCCVGYLRFTVQQI
jgi:hypothetical protein